MGQKVKAVNTVYPDIKCEMLPGYAPATPMRQQNKNGVNMARDDRIDCVVRLGPGKGWFITEIVKNVDMKFLPVSKDYLCRSCRRQRCAHRYGRN